MDQPVISTTGLMKEFGQHRVLDDLNLTVPRHSIYGFIGANGSGKTTTINILLGFLSATSGSAEVLGTARGTLPATPIKGLGFLPDVPELFPWLRPLDALITLASISGIPHDLAAQRAHDLLDLVGLRHAQGRVGGFSRGMKQRLGIAAVLVDSPDLLILDEPTSALDPLGRKMVLDVISELHGLVTILFSSHLLSDVEQVCTHVGMLHHGRLLTQGSLPDILDSSAQQLSHVTTTVNTHRASEVVALLRQHGYDAQISHRTQNLEQVYEAQIQLSSSTIRS
ncbi:ATP-binding cassette domain-containing protein [Corynebacterium poyangense]|uniref:ATP-binding cassette domain-containing protein n=1 Tax=Corynebacterium poyangense TaxID=2684405 RepID=A0A7H0SMZ2_9CORY|nr:ABC transporter ATP-binding protein [Corynebacterium poyangense]MBZ8176247.1 ATP-binding cassette domain-containing protein [Corynebacterium poyangense]QNQ89917.1 ATP-binding cassette domain-containing protein [Corynebacterium poyangense]